ncbi:hypothetical protein EMGBS10_10240 [Opitutia bacterium]|nr:hypothetical protein EMGBS10_10240 [Opitutae bacterium]
MPRTHGLTALAILHNVTAALALLALTGRTINPAADNASFVSVIQVCAFAFFTVIVRRAWASIDGGTNGVSPAKAQGFLFIPFFNFYWIFPALVSLATQTNAKADSSNVSGGKLTRGFGLVIAILFCVTSLTDLHASLAWLHLLVYATYVGFTVTYIWQIRRAAAAFDAHTAPALSEPTKMPTVGIAGIIYGAGVAALLLAALGNLVLLSPEAVQARLQSKGYTTRISDRDRIEGWFGSGRDVLRGTGVTEIKELRVYRGDDRVAGVYLATGNLTSDAEQIVATKLSTRVERSGNTIYFKAYIREPAQDNVDIKAWLAAF